MDLDRTSIADPRSQDLRARTAKMQERIEAPTDTPPPVRAEHGGAVATARAENGRRQDDKSPARDRKRSALATIVEFLSLPMETELDIEVDLQKEQVTFLIRNRQTGEVVREVPEGDAQTLMEKLREFHGALVDRSI